jgi:tetratricopeptide (TPR) repeat protein
LQLDPILTKAVRFARKRKYDDAIKSLEIEASRYYGSFTYYYLLGISYLRSNIFRIAYTYLKLASEQKMRDPNTLVGLAAVYLHNRDTDKAVDLYLEVLSIDESNKIAAKALKIIRKYPGPENISTWIDSGRLHTLFPPFPKAGIPASGIVLHAAIAAAALGLVFGVLVKTELIPLPSGRERRTVPPEYNLARDLLDAPVQTGGSYRYVLTRNQAVDDYNEARRLFIDYRDDAARVKLNRILESNASEPLKNSARILISYMEAPGFNTLKDKFSYSEVIKEPFIYRDCHVIWRGMASNLNVQENHTSFDFLIGYDTFRIMEGIVQVDFDFAIPVNPERPMEILGRIIPVSAERDSRNPDPGIRIQGVALNQAGLLEQNR